MDTPTPAQEKVIRYFAGYLTGDRIFATSYEVCRRRGWIVRSEAWPFHVTTQLGADAIGIKLRTYTFEPSSYGTKIVWPEVSE